jgi:ABC-type branched-subunit amino acid transport system substrate-binding protein
MINVGISTDLTQGLSYAGRGIAEGLQIYFNKVNSPERHFKLIVLDDRNDLEISRKNIHRLIEEEHVVAILGNGGGKKVDAALPLVTQTRTPLFGPFAANASLYQKPPNRCIFTFMTSPGDITRDFIKLILASQVSADEIAFFTEDSVVGDFIYASALQTFKDEGIEISKDIPHGRFALNSLDIEKGLKEVLRKKGIKAIILGANAPIGNLFIEKAHLQNPNAVFYAVNGFFTKDPGGAKIVSNLYIPPPHLNKHLPAVREFYADLEKTPSKENAYYLFYGYLVAKLFAEGLLKIQNITRESIIDCLESLSSLDIGLEEKISFDKHNHQALHKGWNVILKKNEEYEMLK